MDEGIIGGKHGREVLSPHRAITALRVTFCSLCPFNERAGGNRCGLDPQNRRTDDDVRIKVPGWCPIKGRMLVIEGPPDAIPHQNGGHGVCHCGARSGE